MAGFDNVPECRWAEEVRKHYIETPEGLKINYDPALRDAVLAAGTQPMPDLWPLFDALDGLPLALIRGANSNLLSKATTKEMRRRRPDMIFADVPDRGHVPFLDEPASVAVLKAWTEALEANP
jgi:pimeloyl-ACP methyl ester carboxylesterase